MPERAQQSQSLAVDPFDSSGLWKQDHPLFLEGRRQISLSIGAGLMTLTLILPLSLAAVSN